MSIYLMTQAWKSTLPAASKIVLLALCDNANDQGECFPSIQMLSKKCSLTERGVYKQLSKLEGLGFIEKQIRPGKSTLYQVDPCMMFTPEPRSPLNHVHPTPERRSPPPLNHVHPTPEPRSGVLDIYKTLTINESSIESSVNHQHKPALPKYSAIADLKDRDVDDQTASDWLQLRKRKRAEVTKTVVELIAFESLKAGISLKEALQICCMRGWQGFNADWVAPRPDGLAGGKRGSGGGGSGGSPFAVREQQRQEFIDSITGNRRPGGKDVIDV